MCGSPRTRAFAAVTNSWGIRHAVSLRPDHPAGIRHPQCVGTTLFAAGARTLGRVFAQRLVAEAGRYASRTGGVSVGSATRVGSSRPFAWPPRLHRNDNQPPRAQPATRFLLLTALTAVVIAYGSLYPFDFRVPAEGDGAVTALLRSWATPPGRGDFVANVLLYMPLGWFGVLSLTQRMSVGLRLFLMIIGGTTLSVTMELTQYFDAGRVTAADDVYANLLGTILGSLSATYVSGRWRVPLLVEISANPNSAALMAAWAGYRLYPYVPTIDLHKYWNALKPVILDPSLSLEGLYRHTTIWLTTFALIAALVGPRRSALLVPLFCGCILAARVLIVDTTLSVAPIVGAKPALLLSLANQCFCFAFITGAAALFVLFGAAALSWSGCNPSSFQGPADEISDGYRFVFVV